MDGCTSKSPPRGFPLGTGEKLAMRAFWHFYEARRPIIIEDLHHTLAAGTPEIQAELARTVKVENAPHQLALQRAAVLDDRWEPYLDEMRSLGAIYARAGVGYSAWIWRTAAFRDAVRRQVIALIQEQREPSLPEAQILLDGLLRLVDVTLENLLTGFIAAKEEMIAQSEERYRAMFEHSPTPMWTFDRDSLRFLDVNQAAIAHYGYSREEFLAMSLDAIRSPDEVPPLRENVAAIAHPQSAERSRHIRKDGTVISVDIAATDLVISGRPVRLVTVNDVTERERAQQALRAAESQLRQAQKMEAVGRMAGGIAHDFNNMLTVVESYATFLEDSLPETDARRDDASEIRRAAERAARLTRQLLAMSRHSIVSPRPVLIDDVVADFAPILRRLLGERIAMVVHRGDVPAVMADVGQLEQVLMNLVVNARDAMPTGGRLTIETQVVEVDEEVDPLARSRGRHVALAVTDTGIGMDPETQRRIFDPFFTTKSVARGTGLGLSIVHGIIAQAGGVISVYSRHGRGTTFSIFLPVTTEAVPSAPVAVPIAPTTLPAATILIVDDDREVREVAVRILNDAGCRTLEAAGADEARRVCVSHDGTIDAAVVAVALTDGRGDELAHQLRALRPSLSVLLVSGYPAGALTVNGASPPDLLAKPFTPAGLRAAVARVLGATGETTRSSFQPVGGPERPAILLAEDDFILRGTITRALETAGCIVTAVDNVVAAMGELESRSFDVVVSDVYMPGEEGTVLLRSVRRIDLDIPVILMSGSPSIDVASKAIEYGAFRYLTKPLDFGALTRLVKQAARAHMLARLRRDAFSLAGHRTGAADRAGLEVRFDQALDGLWIAFQPIVDASTGAAFGVEALMRTNEPTMAGPQPLLEAANQLGHLTRLSRRVRALSGSAVAAHDDLNLFINLHPDDLLDVDLVDELAPLTRIASRVILEVTERASLVPSAELRARLERIRALGFRIAVDDIGAGYSGLTSFTELTPEFVKIDISLIRDVHVTALKQRTIAALCRLCHEVGTLVVAEGVETVEERDCLREIGCDLLQGFLIGRPGALTDLRDVRHEFPSRRTAFDSSTRPRPASGPAPGVVGAFVDTSIRIIRSLAGEPARVVGMDTTREIDPSPAVAVAIQVSGSLQGAVTWAFSPELARALARGLLDDGSLAAEPLVSAMAEVANMCAGNAMKPLSGDGYKIEISTPLLYDETTPRNLGRDVLVATIESSSGPVRIFVALQAERT